MRIIEIVAIFLFVVTSALGAEPVVKAGLGPLMLKIDMNVKKLQLGNEKMFFQTIDVVERDIIEFSNHTSSDFDDNVVELIILYEKLVDDSVVHAECSQGKVETGGVSSKCKSTVFERLRNQTTLTVLHLVQAGHIKMRPRITRDDKKDLPDAKSSDEFH